MAINISIEKRHLYFLVAIVVFLSGITVIIAYGGTNKPNPGHSLTCFEVFNEEWKYLENSPDNPPNSYVKDTVGKTGQEVCELVDHESTCVSVGDYIGEYTNTNTCTGINTEGGGPIEIDDFVVCCKVN